MAGAVELDSFVRKFVHLWQSGRHARLLVEAEEGNAVVNLQVGLGQALPGGGTGHRGGDQPAKRRWRAKRAEDRLATVAAEKAAAARAADEVNAVKAAEEAANVVVDLEAAEEVADIKATEEVADESAAVRTAEETVPFRAAENKSLLSPIPQIDGVGDVGAQQEEEKAFFTFSSDFCEEDIVYSLEEIFSDSVVTTLVKRVRLGHDSAEHLCEVEIKLDSGQRSTFSWPDMDPVNSEVFRNPRRCKDPAWYGGGVPPHYDTSISWYQSRETF